ncbi:trypsin-3-like [Danaus plexippus]|uniref:trypsin-3-like n=1 Tax=Danaus plexippus TaxID=13037 RepID=UPI002AB03FEC|nr:trypsin-3-like [Danaus plexippus]
MFAKNHIFYFFINISLALSFQTNTSDYDDDYVPRVINGYPAKLGDAPYQVAFKSLIRRPRLYNTFCGGVIMTPTKLLSAAHCFVTKGNFCQRLIYKGGILISMRNKYAVAGHLKNVDFRPFIDSNSNGQWRRLRGASYPSTYKFPRDDIAIVFIRSPFNFNNFVNNIPIASTLVDYEGKCLASGFGRISQKKSSDKLLLAELELIPMKECDRRHRQNMRKFVCTSSIVSDVDKGDSGGPLVCTNTGDPNEELGKGVLIGIVSGHRYGAGTFFTRVSSYYKYIMETNKSNRLNSRISIVILIQTKMFLF